MVTKSSIKYWTIDFNEFLSPSEKYFESFLLPQSENPQNFQTIENYIFFIVFHWNLLFKKRKLIKLRRYIIDAVNLNKIERRLKQRPLLNGFPF